MAKWKCEICGNDFNNFHAQGFDNKIYCPLCFFKKENQELKKQYEKVLNDYCRLDAYNRTQQKEFIKYMNDIIQDLETEDVDDEEMKGYLIQRIDTFKEILQKYKEIIGVSDGNNTSL